MNNMGLIEVICPHCAKSLSVPAGETDLVCMYCAKPLNLSALFKPEESAGNLNELLAKADAALPQVLLERAVSLKQFTAQNYPQYVEEYRSALEPAIQAYVTAAQVDAARTEQHFAEVLLERYIAIFEAQEIKNEKATLFFDFRYTIVALVLPAFAERGQQAQALAQAFLVLWNEKYPKNVLGISTYQKIGEGFRKKFCFITTAVCASFNRPDDCYELNAFRAFRDEWLRFTPGGETKIQEYYLFAPIIVQNIEKRADKAKLYRSIWQEYLAPCLKAIEGKQFLKCEEQYTEMVHSMERLYLH